MDILTGENLTSIQLPNMVIICQSVRSSSGAAVDVVIPAVCEHHFIRVHENLVQHPSNNISIYVGVERIFSRHHPKLHLSWAYLSLLITNLSRVIVQLKVEKLLDKEQSRANVQVKRLATQEVHPRVIGEVIGSNLVPNPAS